MRELWVQFWVRATGGGGRLSGAAFNKCDWVPPACGLRPDGFTSFATLVRFMEFETNKANKSDQETTKSDQERTTQ